MGTRERRDRSDKFDHDLSTLFNESISSKKFENLKISLAAVGGYGRGELSPGSDIDITIIHEDRKKIDFQEFVNDFLYPLWNNGISVDYSIRTVSEALQVAKNDLRVLLGALDCRHIAGDRGLTDELRAKNLKVWRDGAPRFFPKLLQSLNERTSQSGRLAYLLEPDLKEARGGLRDIGILKAAALLDDSNISLDKLSEAELILLNVRDALHKVAPKPKDKLFLIYQDQVAEILNINDADELMKQVSASARSIDYQIDSFIHQVQHPVKKFSLNRKLKLAEGIFVQNREVILDSKVLLANDSSIGLKAAALAAQRGLSLAPESLQSIADTFQEIKEPWSRDVRENFISLIGSGESIFKVIEALDQKNLISKWIPKWEHVRFLPQRNVLHRHTVDRHMLETVVEATKLIRTVRRPDLLLVAALFHDIGKGYPDKDHSNYGAVLIRGIAHQMGFNSEDIEVLELLVKEHLTLATAATRRDLDDPATITEVISKVKNHENLHLLHALSVADGKATGAGGWSNWKENLVDDLVRRCFLVMSGEKPISPPSLELPQGFNKLISITSKKLGEIYEFEIVARDQVGLLSAIAGVLTINRLNLRSAKTRTIGDFAVGKWLAHSDIAIEIPKNEVLEDQILRALNGEFDLQRRIDDRINQYRKTPGIFTPPPLVTASNDIASSATVLEVKMHDRPGILYSVSKSISRFGLDIKAVVITTLGAEAFDTLYLTNTDGSPLSEERAKLLANQVESALQTYR